MLYVRNSLSVRCLKQCQMKRVDWYLNNNKSSLFISWHAAAYAVILENREKVVQLQSQPIFIGWGPFD